MLRRILPALLVAIPFWHAGIAAAARIPVFEVDAT